MYYNNTMSASFEAEKNRKAFTYTAVIVGVLLLLAIFWTWTILPPPQPVAQDLIEIKPGRGHHAVLRFFKHITDLPIWASPGVPNSLSSVTLNRALLSLHRHARPGSLVVLFSDFRGFNASARARLLGLAQHYQVVLIFCYDPFEENLPSAGLGCVSNGGAELELDLAQPRLRLHYHNQFKERSDAVIALKNISGIRVITAKTADDPVLIMTRLLRGSK